MRTFTGQKSISAITRQTYSGSPSKSSYASVGTATCYLRPLTEEQASMNGMQFGTGFTAIFETSVDVREGDKLTIDTVVYTVRGVVNHDRGVNTAYKRCLLMKAENV
jgi:hypothetical protein